MHKWFVQGQVVELSDYDYHNQWLGLALLTNNLGGLLSGFFDLHDSNGNILENHAHYLHENIRRVEDSKFSALLLNFEQQFAKIVTLDREAVGKLAQLLGLEMPQNPNDYKKLYEEFDHKGHQFCTQGFLSHPAFDELRQRFQMASNERAILKDKIVAYILATYPDVSTSDYLSNQ